AINPRLIYVSASGYGESSPYRDRPGQDLLMQGLSGLASISGRADQPPTAVGTAVIDQHGATLLALGVLGALLERQRTGSGVHVEVSMLRAALDLQIESATYFLNGARREKTETPLVPAGVCAAAANADAETFADAAVQAADAVEEISHPVAGPVKLLRFPLEFSTGRAGVRLMPPGPGQHTDAILSELGYDNAAIG